MHIIAFLTPTTNDFCSYWAEPSKSANKAREQPSRCLPEQALSVMKPRLI